MSEPWHEANVIDGLDRIQAALAAINKESLRHGHAIQLAWSEFFPFVNDVLKIEASLMSARASAPCKQWLHDGFVYCAMHKCHRKDDGSTGDCPKRGE